MNVKMTVLLMGLLGFGVASPMVAADVMISEVYADPDENSGGDANQDKVFSHTDDEFVELFNRGENKMDISGWMLLDGRGLRHVFAEGSVINAGEYLVVFGGGSPQISTPWQIASEGALGLNNAGDDVSLRDQDDQMVDMFQYGSEGGKNQSLVRFPEGKKDTIVFHKDVSSNPDIACSPGYGVKDTDLQLSSQPKS